MDTNEIVQKLTKPPFIFILIGVVGFALYKASQNNVNIDDGYSSSSLNTGVYSAEDVNAMFDSSYNANVALSQLIDQNTSGLSVLSEKLETTIFNLNDLVRQNNEDVQNSLSAIKNSVKALSIDGTNTSKVSSGTTKKSYVTVGTWGKDPTSKTTLYGIAENAGLSLKQILNLNPKYKSNPNLIYPGDKVRVA